MWELLIESGNWEENEYHGKSSWENKGKIDEDFYLRIEMGNRKWFVESHK